jgi:hypothetical protein
MYESSNYQTFCISSQNLFVVCYLSTSLFYLQILKRIKDSVHESLDIVNIWGILGMCMIKVNLHTLDAINNVNFDIDFCPVLAESRSF